MIHEFPSASECNSKQPKEKLSTSTLRDSLLRAKPIANAKAEQEQQHVPGKLGAAPQAANWAGRRPNRQ